MLLLRSPRVSRASFQPAAERTTQVRWTNFFAALARAAACTAWPPAAVASILQPLRRHPEEAHMRPFQQWTVLPHDRLTQVDENIVTVTGEIHMPVGEFPRRMTIVRLASGLLVIYSAIALDENEMRTIERFGEPAFLIVPGDLHRLDAKIWKDRYPAMCVVAPCGARDKVERVVHVDATNVDFGDPNVCFVEIPGTGGHEAALIVQTQNGTTLIVNDIIANMPNRKGFGGWLLKLVGFTGPGPRIPTIVEKKNVRDKSALRTQLERWAGLATLRRIIVSHGSTIERSPANVLRRLATSLST
jgi:hypothetical protein